MCSKDLPNLLDGHEQSSFIAYEALKPEFLVPTLESDKGIRITVRHHVQLDSKAASFIGNDASLLEYMVHQKTANPETLGRLVDRNLSEEMNQDFAVARDASWSPGQFGHIHCADIDRMMAKDHCLPWFYREVDPAHFGFLLVLR